MPFKKGQSGNPGGRKAGSLRGAAQAKEWVDAEGFDFLISVARGEKVFKREVLKKDGSVDKVIHFCPPAQMQIEVATYLTDRAYGRPSQSSKVELTVEQSFADRLNEAWQKLQK